MKDSSLLQTRYRKIYEIDHKSKGLAGMKTVARAENLALTYVESLRIY